MPKRSKQEKRRRRRKTGKAILKTLNVGKKFLKKTKIISKVAKEFGKNDPRIAIAGQVAEQLGFGGVKIHPAQMQRSKYMHDQMGRGNKGSSCSGPRAIKV